MSRTRSSNTQPAQLSKAIVTHASRKLMSHPDSVAELVLQRWANWYGFDERAGNGAEHLNSPGHVYVSFLIDTTIAAVAEARAEKCPSVRPLIYPAVSRAYEAALVLGNEDFATKRAEHMDRLRRRFPAAFGPGRPLAMLSRREDALWRGQLPPPVPYTGKNAVPDFAYASSPSGIEALSMAFADDVLAAKGAERRAFLDQLPRVWGSAQAAQTPWSASPAVQLQTLSALLLTMALDSDRTPGAAEKALDSWLQRHSGSAALTSANALIKELRRTEGPDRQIVLQQLAPAVAIMNSCEPRAVAAMRRPVPSRAAATAGRAHGARRDAAARRTPVAPLSRTA